MKGKKRKRRVRNQHESEDYTKEYIEGEEDVKKGIQL